ncbi:hypothetical protein Tco_0941279 [Tanacetum coccineum]|uniref:Retrovirus-related Pol polyprotein from transposon TNT 1-94-like beta-barrel domain-containing protein n=1 Tax=Tanacetum coccineum TaxID=301880 RepID=A0ABQ5DWD8_9ASTR
MAAKFEIEKFNGNNFSLWKLKMKAILRKDKCLAAIGERPAEVTDDSKWDEMDGNAIANLHLALADGVLSSIEEKKSAKEIWDHLARLKNKRLSRFELLHIPQGEMSASTSRRWYNALCWESQRLQMESRKRFADVWLFDTGATFHMTARREWFHQYKPIFGGGSVYNCNDHELKIIGIGSIMVKMHDGTLRTIRDVRHVEGLKKNLLSLGQLDDLGCKDGNVDIVFLRGEGAREPSSNMLSLSRALNRIDTVIRGHSGGVVSSKRDKRYAQKEGAVKRIFVTSKGTQMSAIYCFGIKIYLAWDHVSIMITQSDYFGRKANHLVTCLYGADPHAGPQQNVKKHGSARKDNGVRCAGDDFDRYFNPIIQGGVELFLGEDATRAIPNMGFNLVDVEGFLYLEIEVVCVEFGCYFEVELECEQYDLVMLDWVIVFLRWFMMRSEWFCLGENEVVLSTFDVLQRFGFFLQMGFTLILATLDGLDVGLLGDVIGGDDCDDDE